MDYTFEEIQNARSLLLEQKATATQQQLIKSPIFYDLFSQLKSMPNEQKKSFGLEVNALKKEVESWNAESEEVKRTAIDVTSPWDKETPIEKRPRFMGQENGSIHVLSAEIETIALLFEKMGFNVEESRQIDDDFHMFESLNFPAGHPARDDWDTFMTDEGFIAPAHISTMQNRVLRKYASRLENGQPIASVVIGRTFRNEDLDARHEHTFHQVEGVYVDKGIQVGHLVGTMKTFLESYFEKSVDVKITPFYFPFTEPSFEFSLTCPFCDPESTSCAVCSGEHWIELMGMGMIHPRVLEMADIDPNVFSGFAWGFGIERLVMNKIGIEDIRHYNSGKIEFLKQFRGIS